MSSASHFQLAVQDVTCGPLQHVSFAWPPGVSWVCGDEGKGKTTLLRLLAGDVQPSTGQVLTPEGGVFWVDLQDAAHDTTTVQAIWNAFRVHYPRWNQELLQDLAEELDMTQHLDKRLHMLSAGGRRKVMVVTALASGATVTLLDQPFAALDLASVRVIHEFLQEADEHPSRAWILTDYQIPNLAPASSVLNLSLQI